jgi:hypothetical protein
VSFGDEYVVKNDSAPALAAKRLKYDFENLADEDTSNSRIHKKIVQKLINTDDVSDCIFLIGWTSPFRLDAEYNEKYFSYKKDSADYENLLMNKLHKFDHYLFDRIVISQRWVSIVYGVQQLLENKNINYYMYNTQAPLDFNTYTERALRNINHKFYFDAIGVKSTMVNYLSSKGYKFKSHTDLSVQGHEEYSRFLSQKLRSNGLVERQQ